MAAGWKIFVPMMLAALLAGGPARASPAPAAASTSASPDIAVLTQMTTAKMLYERGEYRNVVLALGPAIAPSVFNSLSPPKQYEVLWHYARALWATGDFRAAHNVFRRLTAYGQAGGEDWLFRYEAARRAGDAADAWATFQRGPKADPEIIRGYTARDVRRLDRLFATLPNAAQARFALGELLEQQDWRSAAPWDNSSWPWLHHAAALIDHGQTARAEKAARRIDDPVAIAVLRSDRRFDVIAARWPDQFDPEKAAARWIERADRVGQVLPHVLSVEILRAASRTAANQPADALRLLDAALDKGRDNRADGYIDFGDNSSDVLSWKAWLLRFFGREAEAAAIKEALASSPGGDLAVLGAASTLLNVGRPAEALAMAEALNADDLEPAEAMELARVRSCASGDVGDAAGMRATLDYLEAHKAFAPSQQLSALICAGMIDEAAKTLVAMLADPQRRVEALTEVQAFRTPEHPGTRRKRILDREAQLRTRPEVRAAIAAVGRSASWSLIDFGRE